jgi:hypothetical protein
VEVANVNAKGVGNSGAISKLSTSENMQSLNACYCMNNKNDFFSGTTTKTTSNYNDNVFNLS